MTKRCRAASWEAVSLAVPSTRDNYSLGISSLVDGSPRVVVVTDQAWLCIQLISKEPYHIKGKVLEAKLSNKWIQENPTQTSCSTSEFPDCE